MYCKYTCHYLLLYAIILIFKQLLPEYMNNFNILVDKCWEIVFLLQGIKNKRQSHRTSRQEGM